MERILATYRIAAPHSEARARAEALAAEQSVELPIAATGISTLCSAARASARARISAGGASTR